MNPLLTFLLTVAVFLYINSTGQLSQVPIGWIALFALLSCLIELMIQWGKLTK